MPKEQEGKRGKPRSAGKASAVRGRYWARATCFACPEEHRDVPFTSPRGRARHVKAGHKMNDKYGPIAVMPAKVEGRQSFLETPIVFKDEKIKGKSRR